jgi:hypothetical protein
MALKRMRKKGGSGNTSLARVGDPLITGTGEKVDPEGWANGRPIRQEPVPLVLDAATFRPMKRRTMRDIPATVPMMNGIGAIFMYTLLGVGDREIADALKVTVVDLEAIRHSPAYKECFDSVVSEFINKDSNLLAARIAAYSHSALDVTAGIMMNGKKEETRLKASTDLLDRAGVKAKDVEAKNSANKASELRIVIVQPDKEAGLNIDVNMENTDDLSA